MTAARQLTPINFLPTDGGRADAGLPGTTGDCLIRAISILLQCDHPRYTPAEAYLRAWNIANTCDLNARLHSERPELRWSEDTLEERLSGFTPNGFLGSYTALRFLGYDPSQVIYKKKDAPDVDTVVRTVSGYTKEAFVVCFKAHIMIAQNCRFYDSFDVREDPEERWVTHVYLHRSLADRQQLHADLEAIRKKKPKPKPKPKKAPKPKPKPRKQRNVGNAAVGKGGTEIVKLPRGKKGRTPKG